MSVVPQKRRRVLSRDDVRRLPRHYAGMELDEAKLAVLLNRAAEHGARKALSDIGLQDEDAGRDIHDLRKLIDDWRACKNTVFQTFVKATTLAALSFIAAALWMKLGN